MTKKNESMTKRVHNLIIVDESGSMQCIRKQAFSGMNETLQTVRLMQKTYPMTEQMVTLITFDSEHTKWHYSSTPASETRELSWKDYQPSAATPLYDAIGKGVSKVNAFVNDGEHVLVTIITDGYENSSEEWTQKMIHALIEKLKKQNWTFTLIGTDALDVETMARSFAIDEHMNFTQTKEGTEAMFKRDRISRVRFNFCLANDMSIPEGCYFKDDQD